MIITVEGKIGSGKTYWAVNYLAEKYYVYNETIHQFVSRYPDLRIITNIDDLDLPHESLKELLETQGIGMVFHEDFVKTGHCIFIIDEAQVLFDRKFGNKQVFKFFQMSRHYGVDILLLTQDVDTMAKELRVLAEYTVKALPRSRSAKGVLRYSWESEREQFKSQTLRFKKEIGGLYRSRMKEESMVMPNTWRKYAIYAVVLLLVVVAGFYYLTHSIYGGGGDSKSEGLRAGNVAASPQSGRDSAGSAMERYNAQHPERFSKRSETPRTRSPIAEAEGEGQTISKENKMTRGLEVEHEPLVPARCYEERDGWRVCFEGEKPIGRYRVHNEYNERQVMQRGTVVKDARYEGYGITVLKE